VLSVEAVNSLYYDKTNGYLYVGLTRADALRPAMETLTEVGMLQRRSGCSSSSPLPPECSSWCRRRDDGG
jgi:hypothetical protein